MEIEINLFGELKDVFGETTWVICDENEQLDNIKKKLASLKPNASPILSVSRIVVGDRFAEYNEIVGANGNILILPPASGG